MEYINLTNVVVLKPKHLLLHICAWIFPSLAAKCSFHLMSFRAIMFFWDLEFQELAFGKCKFLFPLHFPLSVRPFTGSVHSPLPSLGASILFFCLSYANLAAGQPPGTHFPPSLPPFLANFSISFAFSWASSKTFLWLLGDIWPEVGFCL